ncbi:MAG: VWD domain-containing protein [Acidobacteriota bacterium]|nr:VWD domain-containing protein [Acidobacteriota bacterium]
MLSPAKRRWHPEGEERAEQIRKDRFPDSAAIGKSGVQRFRDGNGDDASFNTGSTIVVRASVNSGTTNAPTCDGEGFTRETNNMVLVGTTEVPSITMWPSLVFTESNAAGSTVVPCASAVSVGDTHMTTFDGLHYDFQAYGEFVLAQDGANFTVQTRQAPGPPQYPNTAINKAVAMQMGKTRVAIYIEPTRLTIDGAANNLADGKTIVLPTGVQVSRLGNMYAVSSDNGDSVRATVQSQWLDVAVGLGHAPLTETRGLLGNPKGRAQVLATSNGAILKTPISFADLYHTYADSWRVRPNESLFTEQMTIKAGIPLKPFFASDLDPHASARALARCKAAGVRGESLLEDCALDTTVLNDEKATRVFVHASPPRLVVKPILHVAAVIK